MCVVTLDMKEHDYDVVSTDKTPALLEWYDVCLCCKFGNFEFNSQVMSAFVDSFGCTCEPPNYYVHIIIIIIMLKNELETWKYSPLSDLSSHRPNHVWHYI